MVGQRSNTVTRSLGSISTVIAEEESDMAKNMARSGGGITSRNVVRQGVRVSGKNTEITAAWTSQIGEMQGDHGTDSGKILRKSVEHRETMARPSVMDGNDKA
jgi:hypothetical protein